MYSQLLQNYENVKDDYTLVRKRYDDLVASHSDAVSKLEHSQVSPENDLQSLSIFLSARTVELFLATANMSLMKTGQPTLICFLIS